MCTLDGCGDHKSLPPIVLPEADRRAFLAGAISLPLATVLAFPDLAQAQAATLEDVSFDANGVTVSGVIARPATTPAPAVILIHEWWGLNDQIKAVAAEFAAMGYIAFAIDLYGTVATTPEEAKALTGAVKAEVASAQLSAAADWLRGMEGATGKVGTIGWCFGGGWSLAASIVTPIDATVIYYGRVDTPAEKLTALKGPVIGHFGTLDKSINAEMVGGFEKAMSEAGKADSLTVYWYEANHAFANPTGARYDAEDAALAWGRTTAFFEANLRG